MDDNAQAGNPVPVATDIRPEDKQTVDPAPSVLAGDAQPVHSAFRVPPGDEQAVDLAPCDYFEKAQEVGKFVTIDIPPGDAQTANLAPGVSPSDKQAAGEALASDVPPGDEQAAGEGVVIDVPPADEHEARGPDVVDDAPQEEQEGNPRICDIIFKIIAAGIEVIKPALEGVMTSAIPATYLADILSIPAYKILLGAAIFRAGYAIKQNAAEIRNIIDGCLQCEVHCFTEDIFLEIVRDYETGKIKNRLEEEYLKVGYKTTGLKVKIKNSEEVERAKTAIEKRYGIYLWRRT